MKKLIIILACSAGIIACKKDKNDGPKEIAISKIFEDGKLIDEFIYSQKRLIKENEYDNKSGKLQYVTTFEYDAAGQLSKDKGHNPDKWIEITSYQFNAAGQLMQTDYMTLTGSDSGKITSRIKYRYNTNGRMDRQSGVDLVTDAVNYTSDFYYYPDGNLMKNEVNYYQNLVSVFGWKTEYSVVKQALPSDPYKFFPYPAESRLADFLSDEAHYYEYSGINLTAESMDVFSRREYNSKGYVQKQLITYKSIKPSKPPEERELTYEYVEL